jgi:hypothetical protein
MAVTSPSTVGRRYAPFLALAAVQVLLVAVAPSKESSERAGLDSGAFTTLPGGVILDAEGNPVAVGADGRPLTAAQAAALSAGGGRAAAQTPVGAEAAAAAGDLSRCGPDGRQIGPTYFMPLCRPVFKGDNGGATMTGVTATEIRYVYYAQKTNPQVDALLASQNLAATRQDACSAREAFTAAVNKRWELSGRKLVSLDGPGNHKGSTQQECKFPYYQGQCEQSPPDPPCLRAEAREIASMKPAVVIAPTSNAALYNELGKLGIMVLGGQLLPAAYHSDVEPYYWDVFMDGSRAARFMAEYWCKKLAGRPVRHAGSMVVDPDGSSATPPPNRSLGIGYPQTDGDPTYKLSVDLFLSIVAQGACGQATGKVEVYPYNSNINQAQVQATATAQSLKARRISTYICFCDPIAPAFITAALDQENWEPEHLMSGSGLIDYDLLGRLYTPKQWRHAFGLSHIPLQVQFEQSDAAKAWRDGGKPGSPGDRTSNLTWSYYSLMGSMFHYAGPRPTPAGIRQGLFSAPVRGGWKESKGDPRQAMIKFGSGADDYTGIEDLREVWWNAARPSEIDGRPGSYQPVDGGRRYELGEFSTADPKVFQ